MPNETIAAYTNKPPLLEPVVATEEGPPVLSPVVDIIDGLPIFSFESEFNEEPPTLSPSHCSEDEDEGRQRLNVSSLFIRFYVAAVSFVCLKNLPCVHVYSKTSL